MKKDITKMEVIGTITTKPITFGRHVFPAKDYEVIEIHEDIYITNQWYKAGVPQVVHSDMVETFTKK